MGLTLITPVAGQIVTVAEVKTLARLYDTTFDDLLADHIAQAQEQVEAIMGRCLSPQTWKLTIDAFADAIRLPKGPVTSVSSVQYYDTTGTLQTVPAASYTLDLTSDPQWLMSNDDTPWPATLDAVNAVEITFSAGYSNPGDPAFKAAQRATRALALHWYENGGLGTVPPAVLSILFPFTNHGF